LACIFVRHISENSLYLMESSKPSVVPPKSVESPKLVLSKSKPFYHRRWVIITGSAFLGLILFYLLVNDVIMPLYVRSGKIATVPNVVGMQQAKAVEKLKDADYEPVQYEVRFDEKAAEGIIIRQTPEGGEQTKPGRKVFLIVSGGKEMFVVPSLVRRTLSDAKIELLKDNLMMGTTSYSFNDSIPTGIVMQQNPAAGAKIVATTKVNLTVSQGPVVGRVPVPDLRNMTLPNAISKLNELKLTVGNVTFQSSPDATANTVIEQYPNPGDLVDENSSVDLFVVRENTPADAPAH
jgi:beta-lactam-binding protein with PASTA domain